MRAARVVRKWTSTQMNVVARQDYLPFGEEIPAGYAGRSNQYGSTNDVDVKFTGQMRDSETGMDFFPARYYGSALGRFTSPDPLHWGADLLDPQTWNAYVYVRNNPLALVDPLGLCTFDAEGNAMEDENGACYDGGFGGSVTVTASPPPDVMLIFVSLPSLQSDTQQQPAQTTPAAVTEAGMAIQPKTATAQQIKQAYCSVVPTGRSISVSVAFGAVGAVSGEIDTVLNYNSGQASLFATRGVSGGWNGGVSLTISSGLVYGLDQTNKGFSGPFKRASLYVPTPIPGVGGGGSVISGGGVTVISAGASAGLMGRYRGGIGATTTSRPVNTGRFTGFSLLDFVGYLLRRPCN